MIDPPGSRFFHLLVSRLGVPHRHVNAPADGGAHASLGAGQLGREADQAHRTGGQEFIQLGHIRRAAELLRLRALGGAIDVGAFEVQADHARPPLWGVLVRRGGTDRGQRRRAWGGDGGRQERSNAVPGEEHGHAGQRLCRRIHRVIAGRTVDVYVYEAGHDEATLRVEGLLAVRGCDGVGGANRGDARALDPDAVIRLEAIRGENGALAYEHAASLPVHCECSLPQIKASAAILTGRSPVPSWPAAWCSCAATTIPSSGSTSALFIALALFLMSRVHGRTALRKPALACAPRSAPRGGRQKSRLLRPTISAKALPIRAGPARAGQVSARRAVGCYSRPSPGCVGPAVGVTPQPGVPGSQRRPAPSPPG